MFSWCPDQTRQLLMHNSHSLLLSSYFYTLLWDAANSVVTYDRISNGFTLTLVTEGSFFTIVTGGHNVITFTGYYVTSDHLHRLLCDHLQPVTEMFTKEERDVLRPQREKCWGESMGDWLFNQGTRTVILVVFLIKPQGKRKTKFSFHWLCIIKITIPRVGYSG